MLVSVRWVRSNLNLLDLSLISNPCQQFELFSALVLMKAIVPRLSILLLLSGFILNATEKPNVIVIMADDIGFECYSGYGSEFYSTPNIDNLVETGAKFTQAYSQPICTPSRVKIMTGRYNFRNYTTFGELDLSEPTFGKMVKENGYATGIAGKWQLSAEDLEGPFKAGFDEYMLWHFMTRSKDKSKVPEIFHGKGSRFKSPMLFRNGELVQGTEGKYGPDLITDYILDFIDRKKAQPFFLYYPMILVHSPFDPTPDSPDWDKMDKSRGELQHFREMVSYMDKTIGRIVEHLDKQGLREETLILITGDNGTNRKLTSPFPGRGEIQGGKGLMTDAGTRVAFVANWPGQIEPGTVIDSPIDFADVLPTVGDVTGSKIPEGTDGRSFLPLLRGDTSKVRDWIFMSYSKDGLERVPYRAFVRDERWKLYSDGRLFDVPNDWLEESPAKGKEARQARSRLSPILNGILKGVPSDQIQYSAANR